MADASLEIRIGANVKGAQKGLNDVEKGLKDLGNTSATTSKQTSSFFSNFAKGFAGVAITTSLVSIGKHMFEVTAEFEKLGVVLANTLGSNQLAKKAFADIENFAAKTPFSVGEVTASFVKLANQGFVPTTRELKSLGDLAASTGKGFDQLAEAILDAQTGEFERLKEFGIRAQDAGDKVIFTFKGVSTEVNKTSDAIRGYITGLGELQGVSGSTAAISETLTGKVSNLGDAFDRLLTTIGNSGSSIVSGFITQLSNGIDAINEFIKEQQTIAKFNLKENDPKAFAFTSSLFSKNDSELAAKNIAAFGKALTSNIDGATNALKKGKQEFFDYMDLVGELYKQALKNASGRNLAGEKQALAEQWKEFGETTMAAFRAGQKGENKPVAPKETAAEELKRLKEAKLDEIAVLKTEQLLVDDTTLTYKRLQSRIVLLQGEYNALGKTAKQAAFELASAAKESELLTRNPFANIPTELAKPDPAILKIDTTQALQEFKEIQTQLAALQPFEPIKKQLIDLGLLAQAIGQNIANAFSSAFQSIADGENAFKALGEAVKKVVRDLIAAVIQAVILKAIISAVGGGGGAIAGFNYGFNVSGVNPAGISGAGAPKFEMVTRLSGQDILVSIQRTQNLNGING